MRAVKLTLGLVLLVTQAGTYAQVAESQALPYSRGYLVTGNYVAGGVDLTEELNPPDVNGFSTGIIAMSGLPADADIVAAYLYWETIAPTATPELAAGVKFRGHEILLNDVVGVKASSQPLVGSTASCWSSGSPLAMIQFRADVLRFLPIRLDKNNQPTGKRLVNDADLTAHGLPLHSVTLPTRNGNQIPESAGASLVFVYRDPSEPLRKIVFYDGIQILPTLTESMTQTVRGFYRSSTAKSAKITQIIASGQPNNNERIFFNGGTSTQISPFNPVFGGTSSQRGWATLTYNVTSLMNPGNNSADGYGETVTTTVNHSPGGGTDCLTWGAIIFSTTVADADPGGGDGIPDGLEDAPGGLKDADDTPLPDLHGMGASSSQRDLFIEFNAMRTLVAKTHGSSAAPYPGVAAPLYSKTVPAHTHMPTPQVLKMLGDQYAAHGIAAHFDVGNIDAYHALGSVAHPGWVDDYASVEAEGYLVPSALGRGGEVVDERACDPANPACQFPAYPGTVGWKLGLQVLRDAPVGDNGDELITPAELSVWQQGSVRRRRFDATRKGLFHYVLYAHARGKPRSEFPCLDSSISPAAPTGYGPAGTCAGGNLITNPDFHVPTSSSGVADLPGPNAMVTLGFWDEFVGKPFVRASTTFHEVGHNLNLWHGGQPAIWGNKALDTATTVEANCKPVHQSSMSYLFQVHGLFDDDDNIHFDLSGIQHNSISETGVLNDGPLFPAAMSGYRAAWYAPATSALAMSLGVSPATRFCSGVKFDPASPPASMARVYALTAGASIDWNGDGIPDAANPQQDVNFDGIVSNTLRGFNDWASLRLDQMSAGRQTMKFQDGDIADYASGDIADFGSGDIYDYGSGDIADFGSGDIADFGSGVFLDLESGQFIGYGSGDIADFGSGDIADFGSGDILDFATGSERQELDFEHAIGLGRAVPYALGTCVVGGGGGCTAAAPGTPQYHRNEVRWSAPTFGRVFRYEIARKRGNATSAYSYATVGTSTTPDFIDLEELPNGVEFTYRVRAEFDDVTPHAFSEWSRPRTITAVNNAPAAVANSYTTPKSVTLNIAVPGVLGNDTDVDSVPGSLKAVLVSAPSSGTLTLNANGSLTYKPKSGFTGVVTFSYKANNGLWSADPAVPMSADSNTVIVTITMTK
jgi:hypothetical protein